MRISILADDPPMLAPLVTHILSYGYEVTLLAEQGCCALRHKRLTVIAGNANDSRQITQALENADAVISLPGVRTPPLGLSLVLETMSERGIRRLIIAVEHVLLSSDLYLLRASSVDWTVIQADNTPNLSAANTTTQRRWAKSVLAQVTDATQLCRVLPLPTL